jgi:CRISPR-associated protein Cmr1
MSRKLPSITPPDVQERLDPKFTIQKRRYKLITPLYGGGVKPAEADPISEIRATEVRGHLRFWWRATRGWALNSINAMKDKEEEVWGSQAAPGKPGPSTVSIYINPNKKRQSKKFQATNRSGNPINNIGNPNSIDSYVAFPMRDIQNPILLENVEFELTIKFPATLKDDIESALWAWETFGGLGARTRRGFGALLCTHIDNSPVIQPSIEKLEKTIRHQLSQHSNKGIPKLVGVPYISSSLKFTTIRGNNAVQVWRELNDKLRKFRQARYPDRNNRPFGRSKWPEPDQIRRITNNHATGHAPAHPVNKFPRGKFGLPIIFQFKEGDDRDPETTTLQGEDHDRLASPLLLRPIVCSNGAAGLAAILEWIPLNQGNEPYTPPGGLILKGAPGDPVVKSNLTKSEAMDILPLKGEEDILQAFLNYLNS